MALVPVVGALVGTERDRQWALILEQEGGSRADAEGASAASCLDGGQEIGSHVAYRTESPQGSELSQEEADSCCG